MPAAFVIVSSYSKTGTTDYIDRNLGSKMKIFLLLLFILTGGAIQAQEVRMALLPFSANEVEPAASRTVHRLLTTELRQYPEINLLAGSDIDSLLQGNECSDLRCAGYVGKTLSADLVVLGNLDRLGEKIIIQFTLFDVAATEVLISDYLNALTIEELDIVVRRVAKSIANRRKINTTVEVHSVTEQEALTPLQRQASVSWGFNTGYLYPTSGYDDISRQFILDIRNIYETNDYAVTSVLGLRKGLIFNIGGMYFLSRRDVSPFVGAGLGFHFVSHNKQHPRVFNGNEFELAEEKKEDGFELIINTGFIAFRTYNFRVLVNMEFSNTFNDYNDRALAFTIGILSGKNR